MQEYRSITRFKMSKVGSCLRVSSDACCHCSVRFRNNDIRNTHQEIYFKFFYKNRAEINIRNDSILRIWLSLSSKILDLSSATIRLVVTIVSFVVTTDIKYDEK